MLGHLFGLVCVLCGDRLASMGASPQLCPFCLGALPWRESQLDGTDQTRLPQTRLPQTRLPGISRIVAPLNYQSYAARWVVRAKHHSGLVEARLLGAILAAALLELYPEPESRPTHLVPVPLSWRRLMRRGHNQAVLIAEPVSRTLDIPMRLNRVRRSRHTIIQPGMSAVDRMANVRGAFRCRGSWQGASVAIVDDVLTSGATASALALCLKESGAGEVHVWCATCATGDPALSEGRY